ncbi:hypothetical protein IWX47DRAFT_880189 [Phyllosticta citricarpa]|uniref:Uncharacterized protein n=1 Tax=Phyllosticta citricarpa TaxID=55181 RepID=A0ABR1LEF9_9PEZI
MILANNTTILIHCHRPAPHLPRKPLHYEHTIYPSTNSPIQNILTNNTTMCVNTAIVHILISHKKPPAAHTSSPHQTATKHSQQQTCHSNNNYKNQPSHTFIYNLVGAGRKATRRPSHLGVGRSGGRGPQETRVEKQESRNKSRETRVEKQESRVKSRDSSVRERIKNPSRESMSRDNQNDQTHHLLASVTLLSPVYTHCPLLSSSWTTSSGWVGVCSPRIWRRLEPEEEDQEEEEEEEEELWDFF